MPHSMCLMRQLGLTQEYAVEREWKLLLLLLPHSFGRRQQQHSLAEEQEKGLFCLSHVLNMEEVGACAENMICLRKRGFHNGRQKGGVGGCWACQDDVDQGITKKEICLWKGTYLSEFGHGTS